MEDNSLVNNVYTLQEVAQHDQESDGWLILDGYVHDITPFMFDHPGGKDIMLEYLGKDASSSFISESVHAHSEAAFTMLSKYRVGVIHGFDASKLNAEPRKVPLQDLVNLKEAILPQIPKLGKGYQDWIHSHLGLKEIIIFDSAFLEKFTRWPWWYIFFLWTPIIIAFFKWSLEVRKSVLYTSTEFALGMLSWAIVEYILHRFVFHMYTDSTAWNVFHFFAHGIHHLTPNDPSRLTFPPTFNLVIIFLVTRTLTVAPIYGFFAGLALGFMMYDALHYYFHHGDAPWMPEALRKMKSRHLAHHYKNDDTKFGVTSPLFDWVFGTL